MSYLNTETNDYSYKKFFKFLFNKIEIDKLKVQTNFYLINFNKINSFIFKRNRRKYPKKNLTVNKDNDLKEKLINDLIEKSKLSNLKLAQIKSHHFSSKNLINNNKNKEDDNIQKNENINKHIKTHKNYLKILHGSLDNESYNDKTEKEKKKINEKNIKTFDQRNRDVLNKKFIKNLKMNKENILDSLQIGKFTYNNCLLKDKIIYDIKPLNKYEQKGKCFFPSYENKDNSKLDNNNNYSCSNIFNKKENEYISLDYIPTLENENNKVLYKEKFIINKTLNNNIKENKINTINEIGEIPLKCILGKDSSQELRRPTLKTFYGRGAGNIVKGEKMKFIKTLYPVQFVKPLLTQHGYILKSKKLPNKFKNKKDEKNKLSNFVLNNFKKKEKFKIKRVKEELKTIKKDIMNVFDCFEEQKKKLFRLNTEE